MAEASQQLHEPNLRPETVERHRAIVSLMEELEAIDWYDQRIDASDDPALAEILRHNRDEETEHAALVLEWLRRRDPVLDEHLRRFLFTEGDIAAAADAEDEGAAPEPAPEPEPQRGTPPSRALGIGALREKESL